MVLRYKFGMPTHNCVFNFLYMTCEEDIHRAHDKIAVTSEGWTIRYIYVSMRSAHIT